MPPGSDETPQRLLFYFPNDWQGWWRWCDQTTDQVSPMRLQSHCEQEPDLPLCVPTSQLQAWKDSKQTGDASSSPLTSGHMPRSHVCCIQTWVMRERTSQSCKILTSLALMAVFSLRARLRLAQFSELEHGVHQRRKRTARGWGGGRGLPLSGDCNSELRA